MTKDGVEKSSHDKCLSQERGKNARGAIASINCMPRDRPDLAVFAQTLSQPRSTPTEGTAVFLKRATRYLSQYPRDLLCDPSVVHSDDAGTWRPAVRPDILCQACLAVEVASK